MNVLDFIRTNFVHAFPILVCAGFAVLIIVERYMSLYMKFPHLDGAFFKELGDKILKGDLQGALRLCDGQSASPYSRIARAAIDRANLPDESVESGIQIVLQETTESLTKRTQFLSTLANVTTLLGLFGTVAGLIASFEAVGQADPQQKSAMLAAGIATAMNATMMGLGVAIPCMIAFSILMNRTNRLIAELEHAAVKVADIMKLRLFGSEDDKRAV